MNALTVNGKQLTIDGVEILGYGSTSVLTDLLYLTYCQQARNVSTSTNTNIRYYEKGEAKESSYTDDPTRLLIGDMNDTPFGSFRCVYVTNVYAPSNWTTYQLQIPFSTDMANALIGDNGLQLECVFRLRNTSAKGASSNYARFVPIILGYMPRMFSYGYSYDFSSTKSVMSHLGYDFAFSGNSNGFTYNTSRKYIYLPDDSTLGTTAHHLCITVSKKNQTLKVWLDGVLSIDTTISFTDSDASVLANVGNNLQCWQLANVNNLEITQIAVREAIWKESTNYTPPSEAYLKVADYY